MKYRLKKELTKEDLVNTQWKIETKEQRECLLYYIKKCNFNALNHFIDESENILIIGKLNYWTIDIIQTLFKSMKFDDWFEEDFDGKVDMEIDKPKRKITDEEKEELYSSGLAYPFEGTFMWAVEQMKQGKKVRRPYFRNDFAWFLDGIIRNNNGSTPGICVGEIEATDWEIFEDKYLKICVKCKKEFHTDEPFPEQWETLRCDECLNKFGDYEVTPDKELLFHHLARQDVSKDHMPIELIDLDNLEKAIKRAREMK